ncbi:hypothetical protein CROQUDRAFT_661400 [Cronartium quercuum f. sp. fusiforme G11]|uniref:PAS domain-containing protein n=1 Tax=Cronartium quercuum f. sp. fusiforme G11 TaxID=708437 RepID=A0A9P6T8P6_9BASI|nr:hypothetical protein CROQUDRAFT_661400 [Cronartium quercuum f. sp. fusiforme G11]
MVLDSRIRRSSLSSDSSGSSYITHGGSGSLDHGPDTFGLFSDDDRQIDQEVCKVTKVKAHKASVSSIKNYQQPTRYDSFLTSSPTSVNPANDLSMDRLAYQHQKHHKPRKGSASISLAEPGLKQNSPSSRQSSQDDELYCCLDSMKYPVPPSRKTPSSYAIPNNCDPELSDTNTELVDIDLSSLNFYQSYLPEAAHIRTGSPVANSMFISSQAPSCPRYVLDSTKNSFYTDNGRSPPEPHHQNNTSFLPAQSNTPNFSMEEIEARDHDSELNAPLVIDLQSFRKYLGLEEFRTSFREWLELDPDYHHDGLLKLDRWMDEMKAESLVKDVREYSLSLFSVYHANGNQARSSFLPGTVMKETLSHLSRLALLSSGLESSRSCLVASLHENEFHNFIRAKLITRLKNRRKSETSETDSAADRPCFCLTNPRVPNNPIVMVSPALLQLTGYDANEVVGKTCSLFYGKKTSPSSIYRVDTAFEEGEACVEVLLTYMKHGASTFCLWTFEPLRDAHGQVMFFVARQTDVTKELNVPLINFLGLNLPRIEPAELTMGEMPCSPRMQTHQLNQRHINTQQSKHCAKGPRNYTLGSTSGSASIHTGRSERCAPSASQCLNHPTNLKKDWLTTGMSSVKGALRKRNSGFQKHEALGNTVSVPDFFSLAYRDTNCASSALGLKRTFNLSHHLMIIKRRDHRIMYTTENTLKFFGLPTVSMKDVYDPPLLRQDLLRLVHGRTEKETRALRTFAIELLARGRTGCCKCELNYEDGVTIEHDNNRPERVSLSGELSILHFTPLVNATGHCALYLVSFD